MEPKRRLAERRLESLTLESQRLVEKLAELRLMRRLEEQRAESPSRGERLASPPRRSRLAELRDLEQVESLKLESLRLEEQMLEDELHGELAPRDPDRKAALVRAPIVQPPLSRLDRVAQFLWSKKTYDRVFAPLKADLLHEWMEAEAAGQRRKAWYIKWVRGPLMQLSHMAAQVPWSIAKRVADMVRAAIK